MIERMNPVETIKDDKSNKPPAPEPKVITPFRVVKRGEDTVRSKDDDSIVFADFSMKVLPSDTPEEEEIVPIPKDDSAAEPAPSAESEETEPLQPKSETPVQGETTTPPAATSDDGKLNPNESSKPSSSSDPKSGQSEQTV